MNIIFKDNVLVGTVVAKGVVALTDYIKDPTDVIGEIARGIKTATSFMGSWPELRSGKVSACLVERQAITTLDGHAALEYTYAIAPTLNGVELNQLAVEYGETVAKYDEINQAWSWKDQVRYSIYKMDFNDPSGFEAPTVDGIVLLTPENANLLIFMCLDEGFE
ncbi:hypothetical protein ABP04_00250 [Salmonella enterica subsp. enterica serovar Virchow]|nr:hypothetical protein [Salmonella enterica subsp. enterica serovar Virchow]ECP4931156.1 hypothetical protein [Salmonella enterica subsp. enterica serovar Virchow]